MSNFTVWFDQSITESEYSKVWCIQGSLYFGYWVAEGNKASAIEAAIDNPDNPLNLDPMSRYVNLIDHGQFETVEEALGYIEMQKLLE